MSPPARGSVVFFHAHPDDEAIFTGGTMALLAPRHRLVLVLATQGEQGERTDLVDPVAPLSVRRVAETARAAEALGVERIEFLGYHDSGLTGDPGIAGAFAAASLDEAGGRLARILEEEEPVALVTYDAAGIYGHPDHVRAHEVARHAISLVPVPTFYEATVDREYLHFVETHLVEEARRVVPPTGLGLAGSRLGMATAEINCTIDVRPVLEVKRLAMAAHASQIPETSSAMLLPTSAFSAVYGFEWFARRGPRGPIDDLEEPAGLVRPISPFPPSTRRT